MRDPLCAVVRRWLQRESPDHAAIDTLVSAHLAGCALCRSLLVSVAATLLAAGPPEVAASCGACHADLTALIDLEKQAGGRAAAQAYPQIWWHLWVCPDCAAAYADILALTAALAAGLIGPLPLTRPPAPCDGFGRP